MVRRWLWRWLVLLLASASVAAQAQAQPAPEVLRGLAWLQGQIQPDGSLLGEGASIAAPFQSRSEAALTLRLAGPVPGPLLDGIASDAASGVEPLVRRAVALSAAGRSVSGLLAELRALQNSDGGFGGAAGYQSHALDTALALLALRLEPPATAVPRALAYLRGVQALDGSFAVAGRSDAYVSSLVLSALGAHASAFDVSATLPRLVGWLQSQQAPGELWGGSVFLTAAAYESLHPFLPLEPTGSAVRAFLVSRQAADGSWDAGDPYASALAIRALVLTAAAPSNPTLSVIRGRVLDAQTGQPLAGVTVTLAGAAGGSLVTGGDGVIEFRELAPGPYSLGLSIAQYGTLEAAVVAQAGRVANLGDLLLAKEATATVGTVRGVVSDAATGLPVAGAVIHVSTGGGALTDAGGSYQIVDVPPGPLVVEASKAGYASQSGAGTLQAGGVLLFSPALVPGANDATATLVGTAVRDSDGTPLAGVTIAVTGASTAVATTGADGGYVISGLQPGTLGVLASLSGFDDVSGAITIVGNSTVSFSPRMRPTGTPGGASTVSGRVVDAGTGEPIRGTLVSSSAGQSVVTGANGRFALSRAPAVPELELSFEAPGYVSGTLALNWGLAGLSDVGDVRLVPEAAAALLPDLAVSRVDRAGLVTDPQSLLASGTLTAFVTNTGTVATQTDSTVTVFEDTDGDGHLDPLVDVVLGTGALAGGLGVAEVGVAVEVSGTVAFRDGVLHAVVDPDEAVAESREDNNTTAFGSCGASGFPFIDNFEDGVADGWQPLVGRGTTPGVVANGELVVPSNSASYTGRTGWTDYRAEIKLRFPAGHGNDAGLVFRARNPADFFSLRIQPGLVRLMRFMNGNFVALRSGNINVLSHPDRYHTIRADVAGRWVRTYLNNELIFEYDGLDWETGAVGIEQDGVLVHYDDLRVTQLTVEESFDDGNADGWRPLSYGSTPATVVDGEYVRESFGSSAFGSASWKNYTAELRLRFPNGPHNDGGLVFLAKDANNWAQVTINGGLVRMSVAGQGVVRSAIIPLAEPTGWQTMRAEVRGRRVRVLVNGQFLFDYDQLPWDNGAVGTIQDGVLVHYDDVRVTFDEPASAPDVSASRLVVEDGGSGPSRLGVRAGVGSGAVPAGLPVSFYGGDPAAGGVLLGTAVTSRNLAAGQHEDVEIAFAGPLTGFTQVVARVDDDGAGGSQLVECDEANNRLGLPIAEVPGVFSIQVATDEPSYGPNADVHATATLANLGSLARLVQVRFVIETADGAAELAALPLSAPVLVVPGTSATVAAVWSAGTTLTGSYRVRAQLFAPELDLIVNGSFESPAIPASFQIFKAIPGWTSTIGEGLELQRRAVGTPFDGAQLVELDGVNSSNMLQDVPTLPGRRYRLELRYSARPGVLDNRVQVRWNGAQVAVLDATGIGLSDTRWQAFSFDLIGGGSTATRLEFLDAGVSDLVGGYLDDVRLHALDSASSIIASAIAPFAIVADEPLVSARLTTDKTSYLPSDSVRIVSRASNATRNAPLEGLRVVTRVLDPADAVLFTRTEELAQLLPGAQRSYEYALPLAFAAPGSYRARLSVETGGGVELAAAATVFAVESTAGTGSGLGGSLAASPKLVAVGEPVTLLAQLANQGNAPLAGVPVVLRVLDPDTQAVLAELRRTVDLARTESLSFSESWTSAGSVGATFAAALSASFAGVERLLAQDTFTLAEPLPVARVTGNLSVDPLEVPQGDSVVIRQTVRNEGNAATSGVTFALVIVDTTSGAPVAEWTDSPVLAPGGIFEALRGFQPTGAVGTVYEVVLSVRGNLTGELARARFSVVPRPIRLDARQRLPREARVLAYLECEGDKERKDDDRDGHGRRGHYDRDDDDRDDDDRDGRKHDRDRRSSHRDDRDRDDHDRGERDRDDRDRDDDDRWDDSKGGRRDHDKGRRCSATARLEELLRGLGVDHLVTTDERSFAHALRSGRYNVYLLAGGFCHEAAGLLGELREAVRRGDGLLVDGAFGGNALDDVLGAERDDKVSFARTAMDVTGPLFTPTRLELWGGGRRLKRTTGAVQATYTERACSCGGEHGKHRDRHGDRCRLVTRPAIVSHEFGRGRTLAFGFELLASLGRSAEAKRRDWMRLLSESLAHLAPPDTEPGSLDYVALETQVENLGAAPVEVALAFTLPAGMRVEDSRPVAPRDAAGVFRVRATLAAGEAKPFRLGLRMPDEPGRHVLDTVLSACTAGACVEQSRHSFAFEVDSAVAHAPELIAALRALPLSRSSDRSARDEALRELSRAHVAVASEDYSRAIDELVKAAFALARIRRSDIAPHQLTLSRMLAEAERLWWKEHP